MESQTIIQQAKDELEMEIQQFDEVIEEGIKNREEREQEYRNKQGENEKILFAKIEEKTALVKKNFEELEQKFEEFIKEDNLDQLMKNKEYLETHFRKLDQLSQDINDMIQKQVTQNEEDYMLLIECCHQEYENLVENSKIQFSTLKEKSLKQLKEIEVRMLQKRKEILEKNQEEINNRFKFHEKAETAFIKRRLEEEEKKNQKLKQLKLEKNREFFDLKIYHENEIQNHEKCLEDMKAIYQLNAEKLNYNFKVLNDKKDENSTLSGILKKKERFFLNLLKKKNDDFLSKDLEFRRNNKKLTEQSKKITKQYKDLHKKFKYFEKADLKRFDEIKQMSLDEIETLKQKIIKCNKTIMEQQMCIDESEAQNDVSNNVQIPTQNHNISMQSIQENSKKSRIASFQSNDNRSADNNGENNDDPNKPQLILNQEEKSSLIQDIFDNTEFLFDDKIRDEIQKASTQEEAILLKLNVLRKVFKLKNFKQTNEFLNKIHLNCYDYEIDRFNPDYLISAISKYLKDYQSRESFAKQSIKQVNSVQNKNMENQIKEKVFWENAGNVLDQETQEIWNELENFSIKYYKLLLERKETIEETQQLREQNEELQLLLEQYQKQNQRLIFKPEINLNLPQLN